MIKINFVVFVVLSYLTSKSIIVNCVSQNQVLKQNVNIDLSEYDKTNRSSNVFIQYINLAQGNAVVNIKNAPNNQGFFIIQVHNLYANISLSSTPNLAPKTFITGTNIGLVQRDLSSTKTYQYYIQYREQPSFRILLALIIYEKTDPVPGGCNMIFNNEDAPYQLVTYNDNIIKVEMQPSSVNGQRCESNLAKLQMYQMHLFERNLDDTVYFDGIINMLTVENIKATGTLVPEPIGHPIVRRYFSAYPGTGSVYAVIATYKNYSSAYVPAITYACDINNWDENCIGPVTVGWKILCAIILFMGLFTCYFGHRFFKTQMFIFGFVFGGFISYVSASIADTLTVGESLGISLIFGFIYGAVWIVFWWRFGSPILSVFLPVAFIGYITSCIVFYAGVGDMQIFQSDINYWGIFFSILIPITIILLIATMLANILACSVLGSTAVTVAIDHYIGGNLHYIILNNIRRATVVNFNLAVIHPPFQYRDIVLTVLWLLLIVTGAYVQLRQQKGRPPFPPPTILPRNNSERTPLLAGSRSSNTSYNA